MTSKGISYALAMTFLLFTCGDSVKARGPERGFDPHQPVSNDGQGFSPAKGLPREITSIESFEGFGPQGLSQVRFEDTGAAVDGARPVLERPFDLWSIPNLLGLGHEGLKSIIGPDNRSQVPEVTTFPWRAVAQITFQRGGGGIGRLSRCSGWFLGPDIVVTAGSCVHSGGPGGSWATNVTVYPGQNGDSSPFGSCTAKRLYSAQGWTAKKDEQYDYGAVKLNCTLGNTVGWFGVWPQPASLNNIALTLAGYPGDKVLTQWQSAGKVAVTQARQVFYENDAVSGQSGAPLFQNRAPGSRFCAGSCVLAVHTSDPHGVLPHNKYNHGTRLTQEVANNLLAWRNAP